MKIYKLKIYIYAKGLETTQKTSDAKGLETTQKTSDDIISVNFFIQAIRRHSVERIDPIGLLFT